MLRFRLCYGYLYRYLLRTQIFQVKIKVFLLFTLFNSKKTDIVSPEGHPMLNKTIFC